MLTLILVGGDIGQTLEIDDVILHPNYEQKAYSDIAVLKLKPNKSKSTFYTFSDNCLKFYSEYTKCFLECLKSHKYYESIQNSIMLPKIFKLRVFGVNLRNKGFWKTFCYFSLPFWTLCESGLWFWYSLVLFMEQQWNQLKIYLISRLIH